MHLIPSWPDALLVKVKEGNRIGNKAVYLALGVNLEGNKELLGYGCLRAKEPS